ncbi:hypothetical protein [Photorhabdus temperata]|nr:hypothetical protein [Photorhabdus temperata]
MNQFNEKYEPIFNRVCAFLGKGWRIDKRDKPDFYRIRLMNPALKNYSISVRLEKDRLILTGGVIRSNRYCQYSTCSVSPSRWPWGIAEDIKKKILVDADKQIAFAAADQVEVNRLRKEKCQVIHLLSRLVDTSDYNGCCGVMCSIKVQGISGDVAEGYGETYKLKLHDLSKDQLIKIVGFLSNLER